MWEGANGQMRSQKLEILNSLAQTSLTICQISVINYHEQVAWFYQPWKKLELGGGLSASINALSGASNGLMNILVILIWMNGCGVCVSWLLGSSREKMLNQKTLKLEENHSETGKTSKCDYFTARTVGWFLWKNANKPSIKAWILLTL